MSSVGKNNQWMLNNLGGNTSGSGGTGQGWNFFASVLPALFGAASNAYVGGKAADAEREKAKAGMFGNWGFGAGTGVGMGNNGNNNSMWGWIIGLVLILGIIGFVVFKAKKA